MQTEQKTLDTEEKRMLTEVTKVKHQAGDGASRQYENLLRLYNHLRAKHRKNPI